MQIYKPLQLVCYNRTFTAYKRHFMGLTTFIPFNLLTGKVGAEQQFWSTAMGLLESGIMFDSGVAKDHHEFFLNAIAYPPEQKAVKELEVGVRVGNLSKSLTVIGERYWIDNKISEPRPFTAMPICYANAFGGADFAFNRLGRGMTATDDLIPLPTIEYPQQRISRRSDRPQPAGFGQLAIDWQPRYGYIGSYKDPVEDDFGYAADIDWRFFNDAPEDQWFKQPLKGDESYLFLNLHPKHPRIEGKLPPFIARNFVRFESDQGPQIQEVQMQFDSLWFAPHELLGVLIFHGAREVNSRFANEITHQLMAFEDRHETPRDLPHYQFSMNDRMNMDMALKYSLYSRDIIPASCDCLLEQTQEPTENGLQFFMMANLVNMAEQQVSERSKVIVEQLTAAEQQLAKSEAELAILPATPEIQQRLTEMQAARQKIIAEQQKIMLLASNAGAQLRGDPNSTPPPIDDPDHAALLAFVASCFPPSKKNPQLPDLAAIDLKRFEQFEPMLQALVAKRIAALREQVTQQFSDLRAELGRIQEQVATERPKIVEQITLFETQILPHRAALEQRGEWPPLEAKYQQYQHTVATMDALPEKIDAVNQAEVRFIAKLEGRLPDPLPRISGNGESSVTTTLATIKTQLQQNIIQLQQLVSDLDQQIATATAQGDMNTVAELQKGRLNASNGIQNIEQSIVMQSDPQQQAQLQQQIAQMDALSGQGYLMGAHLFGEGAMPNGHQPEQARQQFLANPAYAPKDLAGITLSNCRIVNGDLAGRYLEQVTFSNVIFEKCDFNHAVMVRGKFSDCRFTDCNFDAANLGASHFTNCEFTRVSMKETTLSRSLLNRVKWHDCQLELCQMLEIEYQGPLHFERCQILRLNLLKCQPGSWQFDSCHLEFCVFLECHFHHLVINDTTLKRSTFVQFSSDQPLEMRQGFIDQSSFVIKAQLDKAQFIGVRADRASFQGAQLNHSVWHNSDFDSCLFAEASLKKADFHGADCRRSNFNRTLLTAAIMSNCNLMECDMSEAHLVSVNFNDSNLFSANFMDVTLGDNSYRRANLDRTLLTDWQP
ncbi:MAG: DUF2169 domain-containing protein [Gammaproteobacteria bacterium]|nr:DUF2169 domain-containing protein [Gammaproteobacteria bacterium]